MQAKPLTTPGKIPAPTLPLKCVPVSHPFIRPQELKEVNKDVEIITSSTEEVSIDTEDDQAFETIFREECNTWLALYGQKFFSIEVAKNLAWERKKGNTKNNIR